MSRLAQVLHDELWTRSSTPSDACGNCLVDAERLEKRGVELTSDDVSLLADILSDVTYCRCDWCHDRDYEKEARSMIERGVRVVER